MDFDPDESQQLIRESAREFLAGAGGIQAVQQMADATGTCSPEIWSHMAELGWMGVPFPEEYGGLGLGLLDLSMILEEMGRVNFPGPFFATVALGGLALLTAGSEEQKREWLPRIANGSCKAALALHEADGGNALYGKVATIAVPSNGGYVLTGVKSFVLSGDEADVILCPARIQGEPEGFSLFLLGRASPGMSVRRLTSVDTTRAVSEVRLEGVQAPVESLLGERGRGKAHLAAVLDLAAAALCAEMNGGTQQTLQMSVRYSRERVQFGKPIGAFQAIKHKGADMHVRSVTADAAARYLIGIADQALRGEAVPLSYVASIVTSYCQQAFYRNACDAVQIHGGIAFTWEFPLHLYLKRSKSNEVLFGDAAWRRELIMQMVGDHF